jgi:hypothetical protein
MENIEKTLTSDQKEEIYHKITNYIQKHPSKIDADHLLDLLRLLDRILDT